MFCEETFCEETFCGKMFYGDDLWRKNLGLYHFYYDILASSLSSMVKYSGKKAGCRKDEEDAGLSKRVSALDGSGVRGL